MIAKPTALLLSLLLLGGCMSSHSVRRHYLRQRAETLPTKPARPVIVIPGFGISRLYDPQLGRYVWGTGRAMIIERFPDDFDLPLGANGGDRLIARGFVGKRAPMNTAWHVSDALEHFARYGNASESPDARSTNLYTFAYDWRLSHETSAARLAAYIERVRQAHGGSKVDLVTHSAGSIVALALLASKAGDAVANVVMLAPPLRGSLEAFRLLNDEERFVRRVIAPETSATFASVTELLPDDGEVLIAEDGSPLPHDIWDAATWRTLGLSIYGDDVRRRVIAEHGSDHYYRLVAHFEASLARARRRRMSWRSAIDDPRISAVASDCVATTRRVLARGDGTLAFYRSQLRGDEAELATIMFEPGDGSIPFRSASLDATRTTVLCDGHFGIALDPSSMNAVIRTLARGEPQVAKNE